MEDSEGAGDWRKLLDESLHSDIELVFREGLLPPVFGYELADGNGPVVAYAEAAWPEKNVAVLLEEQIFHRNEFESRGWTVFDGREISANRAQLFRLLGPEQDKDRLASVSARQRKVLTFVIMANSVMHNPNSCIAGCSLTLEEKEWIPGPWVRPVSARGKEGIAPDEQTYEDGSKPKVMDIVRVSVDGTENNPAHPENYVLTKACRWKKIGTYPLEEIGWLVEKPNSLWLCPNLHLFNDRVDSSFHLASKPVCSICCIRPRNLEYRISLIQDSASGLYKKRRRAVFWYNGIWYNLAITDPQLEEKYFQQLPSPGEPEMKVIPRDRNRIVLVISLARRYTDGYHYKLVASAIEH